IEAVLTLGCATLILFMLIRLAPGDPAALLLGPPAEVALHQADAYEQKAAELREQWGLDQPMPVQYANWLGRLLQLDLGTSLHTGREVRADPPERRPATLQLTLAALAVQLLLGLLRGVVSALKAGTASDELTRLAGVPIPSSPAFVTDLLLLIVFAVRF